ncbi:MULTISPECIES: DNA-directed RNA polymerase subunit omega [Paenibacillus]|uniref:DNA-directed RNA polymerase subunit omega n=1 Tax=Paenibacillus vini TaxID=1476024 RepID=A0ABQ4M7G5_9BACL|nr:MULTISPECIES: DNA-directed RNA polymerase subunit omega [Paenibacillus]MBQ4897359.1 DNA-directed RNA polymerase subunit omega [Paenibacillus sp. Marseille-P2973]MDN4067285.1 DNA-directed RNA polymerase subunit omega [Paenibacillus vini]GIP51907.1 DNA-directed RNA polymerase subunit omega [Paenibacillus vini]
MLYPSIDKMLGKVGSKYSLVVAASRRARQLREGEKSELKQPRSHKQVGVALEEIYGDYVQLRQGSQVEPDENK